MQFDHLGRILAAEAVSRSISRRRWIALSSAAAIAACQNGISLATTPADAHDLTCDAELAEFRRVKLVVESSGNLHVRPVVSAVKGKVVNQDEAPIRNVPFEVNVTQLYDERVLRQSAAAIESLRYYRTVEGTLSIAQQPSKPELAEQRKWIAANLGAEGRAYFCPTEPLRREELDLIDVPGNPLALDRLAPSRPMKVGETWTHDNAVLESLLGIDKVIEQKEVKSKLQEIKDGVAIIALTGGVTGSAQSVKTEIQLQAKYNIDLKARHVTWLALSLSEKRDISPAQPGYESTSRIRLATMPIETPAELNDANKDRLKAIDPLASKILSFESIKGGFRFVHDSRWYSMVDRNDGSVLRLVDKGDLVAQCTITDLPKLSPGQRTSLATFQAEIKTKLGKSFQAIQEAGESKTESGLTLQRVVASAVADELPVTWIYYLAIRDDGRRVALMFTHDSGMAERFAAADVTVASSLQFVDKEAAATTKPSNPTSAVWSIPAAPPKASTQKTSSRKNVLR